MNRFLSFLIVVLSVMLAAADATSQAQTENYEHLKGLEWLVGQWEAEYELPAGFPKIGAAGSKIHSRVAFQWFQNKNYLLFTGTDTTNGEAIITFRETTAWDAKSGKLVHTIFHSSGFHGQGEWSGSGDDWDLKWSVRGPDNSVYAGTSKHERIDENSYIWHLTDVTHDGKKLPDWPKVTYKRVTLNAGSDAVPKKAIAAMRSLVGRWSTKNFMNGVAVGAGTNTRRWLEGRHATLMKVVRTENGAQNFASGISGWDAKNKQLVENWHASDGLSVTVRYPLTGIKKDAWTGNFSVTTPDGRQYDGDCVLKKTATGLQWIAEWMEDEKPMVRKSVLQRIQ